MNQKTPPNFICLKCGKCQDVCSIFKSTNSGSAMEKLDIISILIDGTRDISAEEIDLIFNCTKCEACQSVCPQNIELITIFDWARAKIVENHGLRNEKQKFLIKNILEKGNPFGENPLRLENVQNSEYRTVISNNNHLHKNFLSKNKTLLHLGCMLAYRLPEMRCDVLTILDRLKIHYDVLEDEKCCGYFIWNTGDHDSAEIAVINNEFNFEKYDRVICACAGCYTFFKSNYCHPEKFIHIIDLIDEELNDNQKLLGLMNHSQELDKKVVFHDSCHLTRPYGIYEAPRRILNKIGYEYVNFDNYGIHTLCCGADGGMRIVNPDLANKIGRERVIEAKKHAKILSTLCPFCIFNFEENSNGEIKIESLYNEIRLSMKHIKKII